MRDWSADCLTASCGIVIGSLSLVLAYAPPIRADTCEVSGFKAIRIAQAHGFTFESRRVEGRGSCIRTGTSFTVSSSNNADVVCRISFFESRSLSPRWHLKSAEFSSQFVYEEEPAWNSSRARLTVHARAAKGLDLTFSLRSIRIEGPNCEQWEEAFSDPSD